MSGQVQTRVVLYVAFLLLFVWEGYVLLRYGRRATISYVLGDLMASDPIVLMVVVGFLVHCAYAAKENWP